WKPEAQARGGHSLACASGFSVQPAPSWVGSTREVIRTRGTCHAVSQRFAHHPHPRLSHLRPVGPSAAAAPTIRRGRYRWPPPVTREDHHQALSPEGPGDGGELPPLRR